LIDSVGLLESALLVQVDSVGTLAEAMPTNTEMASLLDSVVTLCSNA